jgi:ferrochelatase
MNKFSALHYDIDPVFHAANKPAPKVGVLLTNLGTPDAPTAPALRRYLREFLSDPRVIEIPRLAWMFILHGIILRVRPKKSAKLYQSVWTSEGSPLLVISKQQHLAVQEQLGDSFSVKLGMRYGNPSIASALRELQQEGVRKIIILPLYPQYAAPTTGSSFDAVVKEMTRWRWVPEVHFINNYCAEPLYIEAVANSVREHIEKNGKPQKLIFSYHGTPKRNLELGDPYYCLCIKTTRLVAEKLGLDKDEYIASFQSRFGYAEWLKPYTDETLKNLPAAGIKNVAILSPAFSADCLETLEELAVENRHTFMEAGGESYHYIAALNDRKDHIHALVELLKSKV